MKRWIAFVLCLSLLTGCGARPKIKEETAKPEGRELLCYLPLDDRPDNVERPVFLAESLGYDIRLPEEDWYMSRLDHQPLNENGTQYGNREKQFAWIQEQEEQGCNYYILSLDQLLSGGLIQSRCSLGEKIVLPDGTSSTEEEALSWLLRYLSGDSENRVWLLDSVMRLAPTVGYAGGTLEDYQNLRAFAMEPRLDTKESLEDVLAKYCTAKDESQILPSTYSLSSAQVEQYLLSRERKLNLTAKAQEMIKNLPEQQFSLLIGIDDSSEEESIQKNEIAFLRQGLRGQDAILSGVDDLAFKAMAKMYLAELGEEVLPSVRVTYIGGTEDQPACAYDYLPLTEIMKEHLEFFKVQESEDADLEIIVLTQPLDPSQKESYCLGVSSRLNTLEKEKCPAILIDAGNGMYGTLLQDTMLKRSNVGYLLAYAGFLDMAIVTGTALSHGFARYGYLMTQDPGEYETECFEKTLADSVIKDFCYKHMVRDQILQYVRGDLGGSADNFYDPELNLEQVTKKLTSWMETAVQETVENLESSNLFLSLQTQELVGWSRIQLGNYEFPWNRAFEIRMDLQVGQLQTVHKRILGNIVM